MEKWFRFTSIPQADIFDPFNYSRLEYERPNLDGCNKISAILAEDNGEGRPIINRQLLSEHFIIAANGQQNYGIVTLNNRYIKNINWLQRLVIRFIDLI